MFYVSLCSTKCTYIRLTFSLNAPLSGVHDFAKFSARRYNARTLLTCDTAALEDMRVEYFSLSFKKNEECSFFLANHKSQNKE